MGRYKCIMCYDCGIRIQDHKNVACLCAAGRKIYKEQKLTATKK